MIGTKVKVKNPIISDLWDKSFDGFILDVYQTKRTNKTIYVISNGVDRFYTMTEEKFYKLI